MGMVLRSKSNTSLPTHQYTRVSAEPQHVTRQAQGPPSSRVLSSSSSSSVLGSLLKRAVLVVGVVAPVVSILIWRHLFSIDVGATLVENGGSGSSIEKTFTVRMNTFRRNDLLKRSAEHLASCDCVGQIQVVWSDQENAPPSMDLFTDRTRRKVVFEVHDTNSLSHRFNVTSTLGTDGVFSTDDDLEISCADLKFGFETWRASQNTMVGFSPRLVTRDPGTGRHSYRSWRVVRWNGVYNVILTKCCFLHRDHLQTYVDEMTAPLLAYIDEHRNCEDIAMSVVVAKFHKTPPVWVGGRVKEIGGDGISGLAHHFDARSNCVDFFAEEFGDMPLLESSVKVYPMHTGLLSWL
ncbi:unnamed protein product [Ectocarpus sp. 4 AP-2014]